jgi:hypothetical protein
MFTRLQCLLRLHKWQIAPDGMGGTHKHCANCSKTKRLETFEPPDHIGKYGGEMTSL